MLDAFDAKHGICRNAEVTLECDPGTFDERKLQAYVDAGITRVSLGCQSFDDEALEAAGLPLAITHEPGHMLVTDLKNSALVSDL